MKSRLLIINSVCILGILWAQEKTFYLKSGDKVTGTILSENETSIKLNAQDDIVEIGGIKFKVVKKGNSDRKYIWFHGDEKTAKMALDHHMKTNEGTAYYIQNKLREVNFHGGLLDPNRIFSSDGIEKNIQKYNPQWSLSKKMEILASFDRERPTFLNEIFPKNGGLLIAIHNNFRGYNVNKEIKRSDSISIKIDQDPRDFFLCTNRTDFELLAKSPYNVVLQEKWTDEDDGSLSWAALRYDVRYVLLETRLGWFKKQKEMLNYLHKNLK